MGEWAGYAGFADIHFYSPPLAGPRARGRRETQILHLGHQHVLQEAHTRRTEKEVGEVFDSPNRGHQIVVRISASIFAVFGGGVACIMFDAKSFPALLKITRATVGCGALAVFIVRMTMELGLAKSARRSSS